MASFLNLFLLTEIVDKLLKPTSPAAADRVRSRTPGEVGARFAPASRAQVRVQIHFKDTLRLPNLSVPQRLRYYLRCIRTLTLSHN